MVKRGYTWLKKIRRLFRWGKTPMCLLWLFTTWGWWNWCGWFASSAGCCILVCFFGGGGVLWQGWRICGGLRAVRGPIFLKWLYDAIWESYFLKGLMQAKIEPTQQEGFLQVIWMSQEVCKWGTTYLYMGYIGVNFPPILTIDPNFQRHHPSSEFSGNWMIHKLVYCNEWKNYPICSVGLQYLRIHVSWIYGIDVGEYFLHGAFGYEKVFQTDLPMKHAKWPRAERSHLELPPMTTEICSNNRTCQQKSKLHQGEFLTHRILGDTFFPQQI